MTHLHVHSWFSFLAAASSADSLVKRAAHYGQEYIAVTDDWTLAGSVQHALACKKAGIHPLHGSRVIIKEGNAETGLVLLAADADGYANLCDILTYAHRVRLKPSLDWEHLHEHSDGLFCLIDIRSSVVNENWSHAREALCKARQIFRNRLFVELTHQAREGDSLFLDRMQKLAEDFCLPTVASNAVRHAAPRDYRLYDALVCAKNRLTVYEGHPERPTNKFAFLCDEEHLRRMGMPRAAIANTDALARECKVDLLAPEVIPPHAFVPEGMTPRQYLRQISYEGFRIRYPNGNAQAVTQREKELKIIEHLELEEFFLCVQEVMRYAKSRNILCSGRGSAANSVVAYLLGITEVDPIAHKLLFERFLHEGRKGMPDIDCDFESSRRAEVIEWMHQRWGETHTAMTANHVTFQLRSAFRLMLKILGFPLSQINRASKLLPGHGCHLIHEYRGVLAEMLGESPALDVVCDLVSRMDGCPRHLGQHSGGMILSRKPLRHLSPIQTAANGVRQLQFNKDDIELRGEIKFDVLGLRALSVVSEAINLIQISCDTSGTPFDSSYQKDFAQMISAIPLDDTETFDMICSGQTLGVFQIESPGQWHLLSQTQPRTFLSLVMQVALFRPGPLQSNMVGPYVAACRGISPVRYMHPSLEPILKDTYGIILFQEQILEIAYTFAGMNLQRADEFRRLMSRFRDAHEMQGMRDEFVDGAIRTQNASVETANKVFDIVAAYVGYGFCRSHAAAFALWVYVTAYLKTHYPAQYLAGVLEHKPGFWPDQSFIEEARHRDIPILPVNLERSEARYTVEFVSAGTLGMRIPFTQVKGISADAAVPIVLERAIKPFTSVTDAVERLPHLDIGQWEALARAGALASFGDRREVLWQVRSLCRNKKIAPEGQLTLEMAAVPSPPPLNDLTLSELAVWDIDTLHFVSGHHPMTLHRTHLQHLGVKTIASLQKVKPGTRVMIGGSVISRQRPPTAKGMTFIVLEDETGRLPTAIFPHVYEKFAGVLYDGALVFEGKLETAALSNGKYRGITVERAWRLESLVPTKQAMLGAAGFPGQSPRFPVKNAESSPAPQSRVRIEA